MGVSGDEARDMEFGSEEVEMKNEKVRDGLTEVVRWERFLPKMVLRVLLVEADDSTRQILTALLRKCSYKVAAVSDGLMAWETLKGREHHIDLILTELDLPSISGYALLTLVMEDDACKNIPVIMMSPHDSIAMVLKCMLKGAADFLIKPVRKNELKNLWQHVWRRHAGDGGRVPQSLPASQAKFDATAENDQSDGYASAAQRNVECCEKGSDTQSSCSAPFAEAENGYMQNMQVFSQPMCRNADPSDLTPKMHIEHARSDEESAPPMNRTGEKLGRRLDENHGLVEALLQNESVGPENFSDNGNMSNRINRCNDGVNELSDGAIDLIGAFGNCTKSSLNCPGFRDDCAPELELSLKRYCPSSIGSHDDDGEQKFNRFNSSAFSRYDTQSLNCLAPAVASNFSKLEEGRSRLHEPYYHNQLSRDGGVNSDQRHASTSNNQENVTSCVSVQSGQVDLPYQRPQLGTVHGLGMKSHDPQPVFSTSRAWITDQSCRQEAPSFYKTTSLHSNLDVHDSRHDRQWSEESVDGSLDRTLHKQDDNEVKHGSSTGGESTCTNVCNEGVASNENSSTHGGIGKSEGTAPESLNGENLLACDGFMGTASHRSSLREAALTKFRMKRKERCFEKKVRYQSRKKLAEQRPRVKGQFVRLPQNDTSTAAHDFS